jgi:two-component system phosphate regulon response regulator PhoB
MERPRVLLVDDDDDVRLMTRVNLGFEGFDIDEAVDGFAGLASARERKPDAIVLDVMMPGRDGLDVLREIRTDEELAGIPVVLLTARAGRSAESEGWSAGATAYLTKPFTAAALATTLRRLLGAGAAAHDEDRQAAQARLDLAARMERKAETLRGI